MRLEWSARALADLDRFAAFLRDRHPHLAEVVAAEIVRKTEVLRRYPKLGRAVEERDEYREISLPVLNAIYVLQYAFDGERLVVLRIFHSREDRRDPA
jgi:plasmid stabilization system protein ParE